mmetsp:Transcript_12960/g.47381  ORF Transcript_12960/g.47381 Transcript_12960/m.47381 type:complete len:528 (+) Transcript_12960:71-1654(+)
MQQPASTPYAPPEASRGAQNVSPVPLSLLTPGAAPTSAGRPPLTKTPQTESRVALNSGAKAPPRPPGATAGRAASTPTGKQSVHTPTQSPKPGTTKDQPAMKSAEALLSSKRRKRKADRTKQMPERILSLIPESKIFTQMQDFEKKIDRYIERQRLKATEAVKNPTSLPQILRVYVFTSHINNDKGTDNEEARRPGENAAQTDTPSQDGHAQPSTKPSAWTLRVLGRLLDQKGDEPSANTSSKAGMQPISQFFRNVTVELDPELYPDNHTVVWSKASASKPVDGFEVKRMGSKPFEAKVTLEVDYVPQRYRLVPPLSTVLGLHSEPRSKVITTLWQYIKLKGLQDVSEPAFINCNQALVDAFKLDEAETRLKFTALVEKLRAHLLPADKVVLKCPILESEQGVVLQRCYDIEVDVPTTLDKGVAEFLDKTKLNNSELEGYTQELHGIIKQIHDHKRRRAFFLGFSHSPADFINGIVVSQANDLATASGGKGSHTPVVDERKTEFFQQPWVEDAVQRYLHRHMASGGS